MPTFKHLNSRLHPKIWKHDYYTLTRLKEAITASCERMQSNATLDPEKSRALDFGSGTSPYRTLFTELTKEYITADIEPSDKVDIIFTPGNTVPSIEEGTVDLILSFQVLEHVWELDWYFSECRRMLSHDGHLLLSTHGTWLYHPHPGDFRRWTRDGLIKEIEEQGFKVIEVLPVVGPLAWTTQFRALAYSHAFNKLGLIGRIFAKTTAIIMNARMIVEDKITPTSLIEKNAAVYVIRARRQQ